MVEVADWSNRKPFAGSADYFAQVANPSRWCRQRFGVAGLGCRCRAVIGAAAAAFPSWLETSPSAAPRSCSSSVSCSTSAGELAEIITAEHGKVVSDILGEVSRGQEALEFIWPSVRHQRVAPHL